MSAEKENIIAESFRPPAGSHSQTEDDLTGNIEQVENEIGILDAIFSDELKAYDDAMVEASEARHAEKAKAAIDFIDKTNLEQVEEAEDAIIKNNLNQVKEFNEGFLKDKFIPGLYSRMLFIPKGVFMTGRIHKKDYIDILASGDVTVKSYLADGTIEDTKRYNEPDYFEGKAGRKRVLFTHEDTVWITVDPTLAESKDDLEDDITVDQMKNYKKMLEVNK